MGILAMDLEVGLTGYLSISTTMRMTSRLLCQLLHHRPYLSHQDLRSPPLPIDLLENAIQVSSGSCEWPATMRRMSKCSNSLSVVFSLGLFGPVTHTTQSACSRLGNWGFGFKEIMLTLEYADGTVMTSLKSQTMNGTMMRSHSWGAT